jgi:hypothetical protein
MSTTLLPIDREKVQPGFSPRPARRSVRSLRTLFVVDETSPSPIEDPRTPTPSPAPPPSG